ncbi:type III polyketide synthase [Anoxybacillus suryakundensis]|uniref:15-methylpalmitoyl-4-hydroxy-2-pyrone synthase n=1 Tax=Anoxybacillus suryakundensis TaxID=1325335 RepID=A0A0K6GP37_9BACL|nr:3-oxoacyl-[acyl-carrier-protein] synthase III C-terminal domain-containing protein [Anoxybacillus suryakundensis]CUA80273.1 15-methylpalmitoyl-4-hydroxy-2-pyrone synthase [Anoxybacillus suryakundensis]
MPSIAAVELAELPYRVSQKEVMNAIKCMFQHRYEHIDRLLCIFEHDHIQSRAFVQPLDWYMTEHSFAEKNALYIEHAVRYGKEVIERCLQSANIHFEDIEAIFYISTTGIATPSIEARIMNELPFSIHTKRIPIWGLGCAGGAAGIARAADYCRAYPKAKVLVLSIEFCSLTFQLDDVSKSNLIGTSLFADGVGCACVVGDDVQLRSIAPQVIDMQSMFMRNMEDVMGWDIKDKGFYVVFSRHIPTIIRQSIGGIVELFLRKNGLDVSQIEHFVVHPGGKKVLDAYQDSLHIDENKLTYAIHVLREYGNMSSVTVLAVLRRFLQQSITQQHGLMMAMGPGFSCELLLLKWGEKS